ncbi:hypothetical protein [Actinoplanes sp. NPDC026619]|uniref:hypothetical protein n=1 Tax=Actinoplanes sp. NPDC026619 TaxID=3155798 RepID=UPI0033C03213
MDLTPYLEALRADLAAAAAPGGPETTRAAEMLGHSLEASARLALLEALSDAAAEITTRLTDATVEVRLRGREADLVVTRTAPEQPDLPPPPPTGGEGDLTRLTLRMAESLKTHVEQMAAAEGVSVNAWLVRAVTSSLTSRNQPQPGRSERSGKRMTGYFQA